MSVDVAQARITVTLTYHEARAIRSAAAAKVRKTERRKDPAFIPEPGRLDLNDELIKTLSAAIEKVDAALTDGIAAHKEAANGQG